MIHRMSASPGPIRLLTLAQVPQHAAVECRPVFPWLSVVLLAAFVAGCIVLALAYGAWLAWWPALVLGAFLALILHRDRAIRHPAAWLLRADDEGLYIKWRSYQNIHRGSAGLQLVFVPYARIASARAHKKSWLTSESRHGGATEVRYSFLELTLCNDFGTDDLAAQLAAERGQRADERGTYRHYPLSLEDGAVLRIEWNVHPGIDVVLSLLQSRGIDIADAARSQADLSLSQRCADDDTELAQLAGRGELMALVRILRTREKLSLAEAKARADAMGAQARRSHPVPVRAESAVVPIAAPRWRKVMATAAAVALLLVIVAGWIGVAGSAAELHGMYSLANWPERQGIITTAYVHQARGSKGMYWKWELAGTFADDDQAFTVARIGYGVEHAVRRGTRTSVQEIVERFPVGTRLPVYVDPERPRHVFLDRSNLPTATWQFLAMCLCIGLLPAPLYLCGRWRAARHRK